MRAAGRPATNREFPDDAGAAPRGMCLAAASQSGTAWPRPRRAMGRPAPASSFARRNVKINIAVRSPRPHAAATQRKEAGQGAKGRGRPARVSLHAWRENDQAYGGAGCDGRRHGNPEAAGAHTKGDGKDIRKIARGRGKGYYAVWNRPYRVHKGGLERAKNKPRGHHVVGRQVPDGPPRSGSTRRTPESSRPSVGGRAPPPAGITLLLNLHIFRGRFGPNLAPSTRWCPASGS